MITPEERRQIERIRDRAQRGLELARRTYRGPPETGPYAEPDVGRPDPLAPPEGYGEPSQDEPPDLSRCSGNGGQCDAAVQYVTWIGCIHEHVGPVPDCEQHARQLHSLLTMLVCGQCGWPSKILRTEPDLPSHPGMIEMLGKVFDVKVSDGIPEDTPGGGGEYAPEQFINWTEDKGNGHGI